MQSAPAVVTPEVEPVREPRRFCYRCHKAATTCICGIIRPVSNRTGITILQHSRERFHSIGTARIARLGLENLRMEECVPWRPDPALLTRIPSDAALLYPSPLAQRIDRVAPEDHPRHLVIIDGTWFHAKSIYRANPGLRRMRTISIVPSRPSIYRIRREPQAGYLATIEAIVASLKIIEPNTAGLDGLLDVFREMIDRQLEFFD